MTTRERDVCWLGRPAMVAILLAMAVPLIWPAVPPLVDLPSHLARYHVMLSPNDSATLGRFFDFHWRMAPNLGVDLLVYLLGPVLGVELAAKLVVISIQLLSAAGLLWLAREAHGRVPVTAILALPLAYGYPFHFGFVNFCLSMAVALLASALWLRLSRKKAIIARGVSGTMASLILWVCHIGGWGFFGIFAFGSSLVIQYRQSRSPLAAFWSSFVHCLPLALPLALSLLWQQGAGMETYGWLDFPRKLKWLMAIARDSWMIFDVVTALIAYGFIVSALIFRRIFRVEPLIAVPVLWLGLFYAIAPFQIFGSAFAAVRLAPYIVALSIIAVRLSETVPLPAKRAIAALAVLFFAVRIGGTTLSLAMHGQQIESHLAALGSMKQGSRVAGLVTAPCGSDWNPGRMAHLPSFVILRKDGFANSEWNMGTSGLLGVKYSEAGDFSYDPSQFVTIEPCGYYRTLSDQIDRIPRNAFDYVWIVNARPDTWPVRSWLVKIWSKEDAVLYKIVQAPSGAATISDRRDIRLSIAAQKAAPA